MTAGGNPGHESASKFHVPAAFFDFDHTLLDADAGVIFGFALIDWSIQQSAHPMGSPERRAHERAVRAQAAKTIAKGAAYRSLNAIGLLKRSELIARTYTFLQGLPAAEMSKEMKRVWAERLHERVYPKMKEVLDAHRKAGRRIVIVTTGMRELVEQSKSVLGNDIDVIGVEMQLDDQGRYDGTVLGPLYGVHKARAVREYARRHGVDLGASYAYSDHFSDAAFLETVGHPVCVNPDLRLRLHARKKGWPVLNVLPGPRNAGSRQ